MTETHEMFHQFFFLKFTLEFYQFLKYKIIFLVMKWISKVADWYLKTQKCEAQTTGAHTLNAINILHTTFL